MFNGTTKALNSIEFELNITFDEEGFDVSASIAALGVTVIDASAYLGVAGAEASISAGRMWSSKFKSLSVLDAENIRKNREKYKVEKK